MSSVEKPNPLLVGIVASVGMFLSTLDSGIINIALPTLLREFDSPINHLIWIVTLYTLLLGASIMLFGRLADRFGRIKVYKVGLALFAFSSLLCGFADSTNVLIIFRGLQGISAAMMQATSAAIVMAQVGPESRPKMMGILGMMIGLGPLMGPVLGGIILSSIGWRWIFWLNIPICIVTLMSVKKLKHHEHLHEKPLNLFSLLLFALIMSLTLLMVSTLSQPDAHVISLMLFGGVLLSITILCFHEYHASHPTIARECLKNVNFVVPLLAAGAFGGTAAAVFMLPPLFFENIKNTPPWQVGMIMFFAPLGIVPCAKLSGHLIPKIGTNKLMVIGLGLMAVSLGLFTMIDKNWGSPTFIVLLLICGIGAGLFQTPNLMHIMHQAPHKEQASVGAFLRMVQNTGVAIGAAGCAHLIAVKDEADPVYLLHGIREGWLFAFVMITIALCGLVYVLLRKPKGSG